MLRHLKLTFRTACLLALIACLPATSLAFDHLEITVVNPHIVAGRPAVTVQVAFSARVRAVNADGTTDVTADFINAELYSPDVPANLPPHDYLHNGERQFDGIEFLAAGQPVRLRVRDADDASVPHAEVLIDCYNPVDHFLLTVPAGDKFVDQAVNVTLVATDYQSQGFRRRAHRDRARHLLRHGPGDAARDLLGHEPGDAREHPERLEHRRLSGPGRTGHRFRGRFAPAARSAGHRGAAAPR